MNWFKKAFTPKVEVHYYTNNVETKDFPTKEWNKMWGHFGNMFDEMGEMFDNMGEVIDKVVEKNGQKKQNSRHPKNKSK